jgi:hypothetical protein
MAKIRGQQLENPINLSGSFSGSFSGDGSQLADIPASAITGLNLNQISSGSVSASISPDRGLEVNTNLDVSSSIKADSFIKSGSTSDDILLGDGTITSLSSSLAPHVLYSGSNQTVDLNTQNLITSGNIGIGTLTPSFKLEINSNNPFRSITPQTVIQHDGGGIKFIEYGRPALIFNGPSKRFAISNGSMIGYSSGTADVSTIDINLTRGGVGKFYIGTGVTSNFSGSLIVDTIGIGIETPTEKLDVDGTVRIRTITNATGSFLTTSPAGQIQQRTPSETLSDIGGIGGTITSGQVAFSTSNNNIGGSSNFTFNSINNILTVPTILSPGTLQLNGLSADGIRLQVSGGTAILIRNNGTFIENFGLVVRSSTTLGSFGQTFINNVPTFNGTQSGGTISLFRAQGNTTNAIFNAELIGYFFGLTSVNGSGRIAAFRSTLNSATNRWNLYLDGTANNYLAGSLLIGTTTDDGFKLDVNGTARIQTLSGSDGYLTLASPTGVIGESPIYSSGSNVGIGTETPTEKLEVSGSIKAERLLIKDTNNTSASLYIDTDIQNPLTTALYLEPQGNNRRLFLGTEEHKIFSLDLRNTLNGIDGLSRISVSNNFVLGSATSHSILRTSNNVVYNTSGTNNAHKFYVSNNGVFNEKNYAFGIYGDGNVGIGTETPTEKLEVSGSIKADSFIKSGSTSDDILLGDGTTTPLSDLLTLIYAGL